MSDFVEARNIPRLRAPKLQRTEDQGQLLGELAAHFKGYSAELKDELQFWEKVDSAEKYGLVEAHVDQEALENLRELISRCEALEMQIEA